MGQEGRCYPLQAMCIWPSRECDHVLDSVVVKILHLEAQLPHVFEDVRGYGGCAHDFGFHIYVLVILYLTSDVLAFVPT